MKCQILSGVRTHPLFTIGLGFLLIAALSFPSLVLAQDCDKIRRNLAQSQQELGVQLSALQNCRDHLGGCTAGVMTGIQTAINRLQRQIANLEAQLQGCQSPLPKEPVTLNVLTQHNDVGRTGAYVAEKALTPSAVASGRFKKLFTLKVTGQVYAQPLYVSKLRIGQGVFNVVFIATEDNFIYAFDADNPGSPIWSQQLGSPVQVTANLYRVLFPHRGITSTPVIDLPNSTMFIVAANQTGNNVVQKLYALDLSSGDVKRSVEIAGAVVGESAGPQYPAPDGKVQFTPGTQLNRSGLLLLNGIVYVAFATAYEFDAYHGWVFGYRASDLTPAGVFCTTPKWRRGGIWQSGNGLASDGANIYFETGNAGDFENDPNPFRPGELGSSVVKLGLSDGTLSIADKFTPSNQQCLDTCDLDLGTAGPVLVPGLRRLIASGKEGTMYLLDPDNLGNSNAPHFKAGVIHALGSAQPGRCQDDPRVQNQSCKASTWREVAVSFSHIRGSPVVWTESSSSHLVYVWPEQDHLKMYRLRSGSFADTSVPFRKSVAIGARSQMPGGALSLSGMSGETDSAILWASTPGGLRDAEDAQRTPWPPGVLRAYAAKNLELLWSSGSLGPGSYAKFVPPTIAEGKVFVPTFAGEVIVFGLSSNSLQPRFDRVPGVLAQISVSPDGEVWGVNPSNAIFHFNNVSQRFEPFPAGGSLIQVKAGGEGQVWGINASDMIFTVRSKGHGAAFDPNPGSLTTLDVTVDGEIWGLNTQQLIFCALWNAERPENYKTDNTNNANDTNNSISSRCGLAGAFQQIPGTLQSLSAGNWQQIWGVNQKSKIFHLDAFTTRFLQIPGQLKMVAAGPDEVWGVNSHDQIFRFDAEASRFEQVSPGSLSQIAVGNDDQVWGLNSAGLIFRWNRSTGLFENVPGQLASIVVGIGDNVWGLNSAGAIFRLHE